MIYAPSAPGLHGSCTFTANEFAFLHDGSIDLTPAEKIEAAWIMLVFGLYSHYPERHEVNSEKAYLWFQGQARYIFMSNFNWWEKLRQKEEMKKRKALKNGNEHYQVGDRLSKPGKQVSITKLYPHQ